VPCVIDVEENSFVLFNPRIYLFEQILEKSVHFFSCRIGEALHLVVHLFEHAGHELRLLLHLRHVIEALLSLVVYQLVVICDTDHDCNELVVEELSTQRGGEGRLQLVCLWKLGRRIVDFGVIQVVLELFN